MRHVTLLGATGSIGRQTLAVIAEHPDEYRVFALTAQQNIALLLPLCQQFQPQYVVLSDASPQGQQRQTTLQQQLRDQQFNTQVLLGEVALCEVASATEVDIVVSGIVGGAGLLPTYHAVRAGKTLLLANKESLVMMGELLLAEAKCNGARILPIDSEHNALFQCMNERVGFREQDLVSAGIHKLLLTASGGPFLRTPLPELANKTVAEACKHPNWQMGQKISIDSATMMNKGLEFIEACLLFAAPASQVDIVIHPESIIHSLVQYCDGSSLAQLGYSDMRVPIAHALAYPKRHISGVADIDLTQFSLHFQSVELERYPCLTLAKAVVNEPSARIVLNAANEIAVADFIAGKMGFMQIAQQVEHALNHFPQQVIANLDDILALDGQVRTYCATTH